jgi:hypothetical protein
MRASRSVGSWVAVLALTAACGSTVAQRGTISSGGDGVAPVGAPIASTAGSASGAVSPGVPNAGSSGIPAGTDSSSGGGSRPVGSGSAPPVSGAARTAGHGYDARHIYLGFNTIDNLRTFSEAAGVETLDFGDMKADAEAAMAAINARGGVLGRKLVGVYHDEDVSEATTNPAANSQRTCTALTQDHKVFAAVINDTAGDDNDNFYSCMSKAGTPIFTGADLHFDRARFNQYAGYVYTMQAPTWDVFAPVFLNRLAALKYFRPWNTATGAPGSSPGNLGLLFSDTPEGHRIAGITARLAAARGATVVPYFYADGTTQGVGAWASSIQASVLQFRGNDVTHVIADAASITIFATAAEQQRYRPRYGVQSLNVLHPSNESVPRGQYNGAVGVGWLPSHDTNSVEGAAAASCLRDLAARGHSYAGKSEPTFIALMICDAVRLITGALNASGTLSVAGLATGIGTFGPRFEPAATFRSGFSAGRRDIVGAVRDVGYDAKCSCFRYASRTLWPIR